MMRNTNIVEEVALLASNMYRLGWDERNGGNISCMVDESDISDFVNTERVIRRIPFNCDFGELAGRLFVVTGTGSYFKNMERDPEKNIGIVRLCENNRELELLWGYSDGGRPTSELYAHLMTHAVRLKRDEAHRVVIHTHATNTLAMTYTHTLDEREFTRTLWRMCTECIVVFPDGVSVLPWMLCGTDEIGRETAKKMQDTRIVVWAQHGIFGAGRTLDEAFGLIETVEKAAEIYIKTLPAEKIINTITDEQLKELAKAFGVKVHEGWLQ